MCCGQGKRKLGLPSSILELLPTVTSVVGSLNRRRRPIKESSSDGGLDSHRARAYWL
jgi:hypothetical protein